MTVIVNTHLTLIATIASGISSPIIKRAWQQKQWSVRNTDFSDTCMYPRGTAQDKPNRNNQQNALRAATENPVQYI